MVLHFLCSKRRGGRVGEEGEKVQVLPGPLPVTPGEQQPEGNRQSCCLATLDTPLGAHGTVSFTIQPNLCHPGGAGDSTRSCGRSPVPPKPGGAVSSALLPALPWAGGGTGRAPRAGEPCLGLLDVCSSVFGTPPHPRRAPGVSAEPPGASLQQPQGGLYL